LRESFQKVQQDSRVFLTATQKQRLAQAEKQKEDLRQFQAFGLMICFRLKLLLSFSA